MEELLKQLLEKDILSEESTETLRTAITSQLDEAISVAKIEAGEEVRAELTTQWIDDRNRLIEAVDTKVSEHLEKEMNELLEDISSFRDLEAEYANKLVEAKKHMTIELQEDMEDLVKKLNDFTKIAIKKEMSELKEDIQEARQNKLGQNIFEAYKQEFGKHFVQEGSVQEELSTTAAQLDEALTQLEEATDKVQAHERDKKLSTLLTPLTGDVRESMQLILSRVPTDQLEEAFKNFIGRVVGKSDESPAKEETPVLAESDSKDDKQEAEIKGTLVEGNLTEAPVDDAQQTDAMDTAAADRMRQLAGIV